MYFDHKKANALVIRSQKSIAQIVRESGLSQRTIYTLLNSNYNHDPKISTVVTLAKVLGAKPWDLVSE
ncbi:MAG TPA: hypothetical protein PLQ71_03295 [Nitrospira sp.]|nr:hypothetical protein [Nitrospira sp.]